MLPVGRWGQWSQAAPQDVGEEFGLDSYFWVGSSLHIKWSVCISTNYCADFRGKGRNCCFCIYFPQGLLWPQQSREGGGRQKSLVSLHFPGKERGCAVSHQLVSSRISSFPSTPGSNQSWPQRESNRCQLGLGEVLIRDTEVGSQWLCETLKILFVLQPRTVILWCTLMNTPMLLWLLNFTAKSNPLFMWIL